MFTPDTNHTFEVLLDYLRQSHGFDFTGYKRSTLMRRVQQRMEMLQILHFSDYINYLDVNPEEFIPLFNTILINFTGFFRDAPSWNYVLNELIPQIVAHKRSNEPIRAWSAGCASGEEIYTLAIVLAEAIGVKQFRERVQIYGTDVDTDALEQARQGSYKASKFAGISPAVLERYFTKSEGHYVFRKDLRSSIIFCRHNMIQDAPMSKIDLLVCRNALMYFQVETQIRALVRFHFSIKDSGFLFLGQAEMLPADTNQLFTSVNLKHRVFRKLPRTNENRRALHKYLLRQ